MARVKTSGFISSIQGKVSGSIFQRSKAGLIIKNNTTPVNRRTSSLNRSRSIAFNILQEWLRLSNSQRSAWQSYVEYNPILQRHSSDLHIIGQQAFIKFNAYRLAYDLPILTVPLFNKCDLTPISLSLSSTGVTVNILANRPLISSEEYIILFLTVRFRESVNNPGSNYRIINFATTSTDTFDITTAYVAVFGRIPQPGETVFMKFTNASKLSGLPFPFKTEKVSL